MTEHRWGGDYRPNGRFDGLRTACHGCRRVTHAHLTGEDGVTVVHTLLVPGDGGVLREVSPGTLVRVPCPACGDCDDASWLPGFTPPV